MNSLYRMQIDKLKKEVAKFKSAGHQKNSTFNSNKEMLNKLTDQIELISKDTSIDPNTKYIKISEITDTIKSISENLGDIVQEINSDKHKLSKKINNLIDSYSETEKIEREEAERIILGLLN